MTVPVTALRRWLVAVALLRCLSVYLGFFNVSTFKNNLFDLQPDLVNDLYGRTFAIWTLTTCVLCLICAKNPCVPAIYGATLASFVAAFAHFSTEAIFFKTISWKSAANPMVVAGISLVWMGAGWNYYTNLARDPEFTLSEDQEHESNKHD
ncbi:hypothetical protein WJX73_005799 [Symbiochloris irregularis]|uniref:Ergosterol biosynthetic protein 28 n=1 Tax=Symbiochloris irregularis TaxID=706552 RepID=A0AAW1PBL3_9CHLO